MMTEDEVFFTYDDGEEDCNLELALSILLRDEVLFCNTGKTTVVLFVIANDVFAWGCADVEHFTTADISVLYKMHAADKRWGRIRWLCIQRNQKPQGPVMQSMKADGAWDDVLDALPENYFDARWAEARGKGSNA